MINDQLLIDYIIIRSCPKSTKHYFSKFKSNIFKFYSIEKSVVLGSVVGTICKSPFMNKTFRTASFPSLLTIPKYRQTL